MEEKRTLKVKPRVLTRHLSDSDKNKQLVMFDLFEEITDNNLELDIEVAAQAIYLQRRSENAKIKIIGCKGVYIELSIKNGRFVNYTEPEKLQVSYETGDSEKRVIKGEIKKSLASLSGQKERSDSGKASFQDSERKLNPVKKGNMLTWKYIIPRGKHVIKSYVERNLELYAICEYNEGVEIIGKVYARPLAPTFFRTETEEAFRFNRAKNAVTREMLKKIGFNLLRFNGYNVTFEEAKENATNTTR